MKSSATFNPLSSQTACFKHLACALVLTAACWSGATRSHASIAGQWDFKNGDLTATTGQDLEFFDGPGADTEQNTVFGTTTSLGLPDIGGSPAHVMGFPRSTNTMGFVMHSNMQPNGGGSFVNQYTLIYDLLYKGASANSWRALAQIDDPSNGNDADFFINPSGGIGISGVYQGAVASNTWQRVALAVDLADPGGPLVRKYINGQLVGQQILGAGIDGRWAILPSGSPFGDILLVFSDNNTDAAANAPGFVSSIQVHDTALSSAYIAALGAPNGDAIPTTVQVPVSIVSRQPASGAVNVMPGTPVDVELTLGTEPFDSGSITLALNDQPLTKTVSSVANGYQVHATLPSDIAAQSQNTLQIGWNDPAAGGAVTQQWSFSVAPYGPNPALESSLTKGVTAYWPLNEGVTNVNETIIHDIARQNDSWLVNSNSATPWLLGADAKFGSALYLDDQVSVLVSTNAAMNIDTNEVAISAWVKIDALPSQLTEAYGSIYDSVEDSYVLYLDRGNKELRFKVTASNGAARPGIPESMLSTGVWMNVVGVYSGNASSSAGNARIYLNGQLADEHVGDDSTHTGLTGLVKPGQMAGMGRNGVQYNSFLHGGVDDVALWHRALSVDEIGYLAANHAVPIKGPLNVPSTISSRYPAPGAVNVLPGTILKVTLTEGSESLNPNGITVTLNGQPLTVQSASQNGTVTVTAPLGSPAASSQNTVRLQWNDPIAGSLSDEWTFRVAPYGSQPQIAASLPNSLVAYWKLDDGLTDPQSLVLKDSAGQNDGTLVTPDPTAAWLLATDAQFGGALRVDGANTYGEIPNTDALNITNNQVTVSAWVKLQNLPSQNAESFGGIFDSDQDDYVLYLDKGNRELRFKVTDAAGGAARPGIPEAELSTNTWIHVLGLYDGRASATAGEARVYLNGQVAGTLPMGTNAVRTGQLALIGQGGTGRYFLNADVDDIAVWSRALTSDEIGYLASGHAVVSQEGPIVQITSITVQGTTVHIAWSGATGNVQLQRRASLDSGSWEDVGAPTSATEAQDTLAGNSMFYRLKVQ